MALLATQAVDLDGLRATYAAATRAGDTFTPGDGTFLHIKNGSGGSITATIVTPGEAFPGAAIADITCVVSAGEERFAGPFPTVDFRDPSTGLATVTYSDGTSVTVAVLKVN